VFFRSHKENLSPVELNLKPLLLLTCTGIVMQCLMYSNAKLQEDVLYFVIFILQLLSPLLKFVFRKMSIIL